ncbi:MAG: DUF5796 family protein [Halobacteriota archaeon]|uniref:Uncharacterized protein n=1 Tax=Halodesulfurarchaeum formicicum TaxID=1873524 RepID=A0A1J1ACA8_9EURY|nr:DUF5796 family protein [Halodesulfurarchaeum formicicum]APE95217.1 hypothetical protein HSR6_0760 [Halodesulfurarchaeum formicicum]
MSQRSEVAPEPLGVELDEGGIYVSYQDNRRVFYNGIPELVTGTLRCRPGKDVQVLVTDESETEGVMTYVNELKTADDILESSGVGRVYLDPGESTELFEGVVASVDGLAVEITADMDAVDGRVFVFEEDELGEQMYELSED